jgi:2-oxoglutarate dehydrogenase E1 component
LEQQRTGGHKDVAIVRIEQLYPFPAKQVEEVLSKYSAAELVWVQEEPLNMGAWSHISQCMAGQSLRPLGRRPSASTATGFKKVHDEQQAALVAAAMKK